MHSFANQIIDSSHYCHFFSSISLKLLGMLSFKFLIQAD